MNETVFINNDDILQQIELIALMQENAMPYQWITVAILDLDIMMTAAHAQQVPPQQVPVQQVPVARPMKAKTRCFGAARLDVMITDECGICMEKHILRDALHTSCGHCFGRKCYEQMLHTNTDAPCPLCRQAKPLLTIYKERKAHKQVG